MTQEDKQLLLQDLCARLPYGVKIEITWWVMGEGTSMNTTLEPDHIEQLLNDEDDFTEIKPYLRPMSSMTEEEREDFWQNVLGIDWRSDLEIDEELETVPFPFTETYCGFYFDNCYLSDTFAVIDWLNAHHFDYRGLIPKGLAISTEVFNPYKD